MITDRYPPALPQNYTAVEAIETFQQAYRWFFDSLVQDREGKGETIERSEAERKQRRNDRIMRTKSFLDFAGNPEQAFPSVHVAGTSGKGSVTMMIADLLLGAGYNTAHHTSPFLQSPLEKLVYNGRWEKPSYAAELFHDFAQQHEAWQHAQSEYDQIKYGEAWVWLTFWWMAKRQVDWGIVETGSGGHFDPTVWLTPKISVITNIAFDHVKTLGPTLKDIAWHKSGIIKPNTPAVIGVTEPELVEVFEREAAKKNAPLYRLGEAFDFAVNSDQSITVRTPNRTYTQVQVGSAGHFQRINAALSLTAVDLLLNEPIPPSGLARLAEMSYPGRMEPMPDEQLILIDGAHNPHKMETLVDSVRRQYPDKNIVALIGGLASKDLTTMLTHLVPHCRHVVISQPQLIGKRVNPPQAIASMVQQIDPKLLVDVEDVLTAAINRAKSSATQDDLILITGSIYLIGQARDYWYAPQRLLLDLEESKTA
ncbi:MAG: hypothetical protein F6K62_21985 [Sphaerospermopsis sp. SIO1G2]|nr:hypothetical protein [Sphaerospermopsis sp. SIO1G2]